MWDLIEEYKEEMFGCSRFREQPRSGTAGGSVTPPFLIPCQQIPVNEIELRFQQDPHVSFVVKAISALTAAFR
jgi:hypothetical protein